MGCGYHGEFKRKQVFPDDPFTFRCFICGSEYRSKQELNGELLTFQGDSIDMFTRVTDREFIEELKKRGYKVEEKPDEFWKEE